MNSALLIRLAIGVAVVVVMFVAAIAWYLLLHSRRQHAAALALARFEGESERRILAARAEEAERAATHFSRDLHDGVGQTLDLLQMTLKAATEAPDQPAADAHLQRSLRLLEDLSTETRHMAYSLNGEYVSARGLGEVLEAEVGHIRASGAVNCTLEISGTYRTLPQTTELLLYRIAQEALHNAVKHAAASGIAVALAYAPRHFSMRITDDGVGFDAAARSSDDAGLGIGNMRQRAGVTGGGF